VPLGIDDEPIAGKKVRFITAPTPPYRLTSTIENSEALRVSSFYDLTVTRQKMAGNAA
jgi:hypothetical protein